MYNDWMNITAALKSKALAFGFDLVAIAPAGPSPDHDRYVRWLDAGYAGEMGYLARHSALKADPRSLLADARSIILVGLSYGQPLDPTQRSDPSRGQIAAYALGDDYHDIMRAALIKLDGWVRAQTGRSTHGRVFVDSAPMLERSWAMQAGLGFIGKNTCLIHPGLGSNLFLGGLLVPEAFDYDEPAHAMRGTGSQVQYKNHEAPASTLNLQPATTTSWRFANGATGTCGRCTRCIDICPTAALVSPHQLDARRCISYLTIELRGEMPVEFRKQVGNWVFGCDLCQDVCPWNRRAPAAAHPRLQPHPDRLAPPLLDLLALDRESFAARFRHSAVIRAKWEGFMRNICVAAGNWGDPACVELLVWHLTESTALVASHAAWALRHLRDGAGRAALVKAGML